MADNNVEQFVSLTGASAEQAAFFIDSHKGDLQGAITSYFDSLGGHDDHNDNDHPMPQALSANAASSSSPFAAGSSSSSANKQKDAATNSKLKTLRDLMQSSEDDSDDEHQNYFAGGEKSGVMMQGGPKEGAKKAAPDLIKDILEKAAKGGTTGREKEEKKPSAFTGSGRRLGSEADTPATASTQRTPVQPQQAPAEIVERNLTFWRNGFSVEDGPLLRYDDPANEEVLRHLNTGRAPTALLNVLPGQQVDVKVARRMEEDYKPPPKKPLAAFSGSGHKLGSTQSEPPSSSGSNTLPGSFPSSTAPTSTPVIPVPSFTVDSNAPTTSIQIRLADGTRLVAKMNHTHTVADLRNFVTMSRPGESSSPFVLQTTFPSKDLTDDKLTLKDAGLLNAVVVQRRL